MVTRRSDKELLDELDSIINGALSADKKSKSSAAHLISTANLDATDDEDSGGDDGDGTTGRTGGAGTTAPLMDMSVFGLTSTAEFLLAELIRQGEAKFGWVPDTKDPNKLRQGTGARNNGPQKHPLLSESQRFDGADPKLNALPTDNPDARESFNRLANELRPGAKPTLSSSSAPTFKPI